MFLFVMNKGEEVLSLIEEGLCSGLILIMRILIIELLILLSSEIEVLKILFGVMF